MRCDRHGDVGEAIAGYCPECFKENTLAALEETARDAPVAPALRFAADTRPTGLNGE